MDNVEFIIENLFANQFRCILFSEIKARLCSVNLLVYVKPDFSYCPKTSKTISAFFQVYLKEIHCHDNVRMSHSQN